MQHRHMKASAFQEHTLFQKLFCFFDPLVILLGFLVLVLHSKLNASVISV